MNLGLPVAPAWSTPRACWRFTDHQLTAAMIDDLDEFKKSTAMSIIRQIRVPVTRKCDAHSIR
jgi:hypothetical protein